MTLKTLRAQVSEAVFSLPYFVADERGYFKDEGLEITLVKAPRKTVDPASIELVADHRTMSAFSPHNTFEYGESHLHRACEWGQVRRSHDSHRGGRVVSKRAAMASMAIVVRPDSAANTPQDLSGVPVLVNYHHGSHYVVLMLLEGFLPRPEIRVVGLRAGDARCRLIALRDGTVDAVALMEPWITVATKLGFKVLAETHYVGSEMAGPEVDPETFGAVTRGISRAVGDIRHDIRPYLHYFIDEVPKDLVRLEPADFLLDRLRYVEPRPYSEREFQRTYDWMVSWDLIAPDASFDQIVENRLVVV